MTVLIVVNVVVVLALAAGVVVLRRRVARLASEPPVDIAARRPGPAETRSAEVIVIEIRNHAEVARRRTLLARPVAAVSPGLIRSIVNKETLRIMREQLADQGVDADVRLRRAQIPVPTTATADPDIAEPDTPDELDDWLHNGGDNPYDRE